MSTKPSRIPNDELLTLFLESSVNFSPLKYRQALLYVASFDLFFLYQEGWYQPLENDRLETVLYDFLLSLKVDSTLPPAFSINKSLILSLVEELRWRKITKREDVDSPLITFNDSQVLDLSTAKAFSFKVATPALHSFFAVPFSSSAITQDCPKFKAFLSQILVQEQEDLGNLLLPDPALVEFMQRLFGYILLPSLDAGAAVFFVGERAANGKSTLVDILSALVGKRFRSALSLQDISTNAFAVSSLRGKRLNIGDEEESKFMAGNIFKKLITGEEIEGDVKYGHRVKFASRAKFVFTTNSCPTFKDLDNGLRRRIFLIPFLKSFEDDPARRVRQELVNELLEELPGILGWALEGARKLIEEKYIFKRTPAMEELQREFEREEKSAYEFIYENYEIVKNHQQLDEFFVNSSDLFDQFTAWCEHVHAHGMKRNNFLNEIRKRFEREGIERARKRLDAGQVRGFYGLKRRSGERTFLETDWFVSDRNTSSNLL